MKITGESLFIQISQLSNYPITGLTNTELVTLYYFTNISRFKYFDMFNRGNHIVNEFVNGRW